ncbi:response regulator [Pedobacter sp. UBA5917]|jgi:DNA-binding NarL/FixJ family response regulator|uniref:response regulator n=1 Tax=Pedobacter sp. UBA5917 TaxID=1947061 RepID=UPI0025D3A248|nr:response regulator transcription factor [Pedobacter sp. UBA5917]
MSAIKTTIAIVDDHPIVLEGLTRLLNKTATFEVIGGFTSGKAFTDFLKSNPVNIVLLDIILPDGSGIDICKEIKDMAPETVVLIFSNHKERSAIMKMLSNGANGYILKDASIEEIINCINAALNGQIAFSRAINEIISKPGLSENKEIIKLTVREREILNLIAEGLNTLAIAELLFLSKFTVENHRKNLLHKLKAKNVAELINIAALRQLI